MVVTRVDWEHCHHRLHKITSKNQLDTISLPPILIVYRLYPTGHHISCKWHHGSSRSFWQTLGILFWRYIALKFHLLTQLKDKMHTFLNRMSPKICSGASSHVHDECPLPWPFLHNLWYPNENRRHLCKTNFGRVFLWSLGRGEYPQYRGRGGKTRTWCKNIKKRGDVPFFCLWEDFLRSFDMKYWIFFILDDDLRR